MEVGSGQPDASVSEQQCQQYAQSLGIWGKALENEYEQIMLEVVQLTL